MPRNVETLSTWIFRITVVSMVGFAGLEVKREQSRLGRNELQDSKYLERLEEYVKKEHASVAAAKAANEASTRSIQNPNRKFGR